MAVLNARRAELGLVDAVAKRVNEGFVRPSCAGASDVGRHPVSCGRSFHSREEVEPTDGIKGVNDSGVPGGVNRVYPLLELERRGGGSIRSGSSLKQGADGGTMHHVWMCETSIAYPV